MNARIGEWVWYNAASIPGNINWVPALIVNANAWIVPPEDDERPHPNSATVALQTYHNDGVIVFEDGPIFEGNDNLKWLRHNPS